MQETRDGRRGERSPWNDRALLYVRWTVLLAVIVLLIAAITGLLPPGPDESQADATTTTPTATTTDRPTVEKPDYAVRNLVTGDGYDDIQTAINEAGQGDSIRINEGTYRTDKPIAITKPLTVTAAGDVEIVWTGDDEPTSAAGHKDRIPGLIGVSANGVTIEGVALNGRGAAASGTVQYGIYAIGSGGRPAHDLLVRGVTIRNTNSESIHGYYNDPLTIEDSVIDYVRVHSGGEVVLRNTTQRQPGKAWCGGREASCSS